MNSFLTFRLESRAPCQREVRRRHRTKALRRRKRSHVWCCASKVVRNSIQGIPLKEKESYKHPGNWCNPTQNSIVGYSQANRKENVPQASRELCWRMKTKQNVMTETILTPQAQGNLLRRHQSSKTWNTRTIDTSNILQCLQKKLGMF